MTNPFQGPNLQGYVFVLKSGSNHPDHTLTIKSRMPISANFAFIEGSWQGEGPSPKNFTGSLTDGSVSTTCSWQNGMGGTNTLMGKLVPDNLRAFLWKLSGTVGVTDSGGNVVAGAGPGMVSGDGHAPLVNE